MRIRIAPLVAAGVLFSSSLAIAANVNVDINLGAPPPPPPVVVREVVPPPPPKRTVIIEDVPDFVYPNELGFYVSVGYPYDLFYIDGYYYMYRDRVWHRGYDYNGPWKVIREKHVPYGLRKHRFDTIRHYRDREYVIYQRDRDHYRGRHFRPDKEWKERRKHEKEHWKEEKRRAKEEWKEEKRREKEDWKEDRRRDRDDWRDERRHERRHDRD